MLRGIRIGEFDREITLQRKTTTALDSTNEKVNGWNDVETVWAKRVYKNSTERFEQAQTVGVDVYEYQIRWTDNIDKTMRFLDTLENQTYYVIGVNKTDRRSTITLIAQIKDNA